MEITEEMKEFDTLKTKVLKYVLYKKRTEQEVRQKFLEFAGNILDDVIEYLKRENYINDGIYIEKSVNEYMALKNLSIKELTYKLCVKGISKDAVNEYVYNNKEKLVDYEIKSAKNILMKKGSLMEQEEIIQFLTKKGYMSESIKIAIDDN